MIIEIVKLRLIRRAKYVTFDLDRDLHEAKRVVTGSEPIDSSRDLTSARIS